MLKIDVQNREIALLKMINDAINKQRKTGLEAIYRSHSVFTKL